MACENEQTHIVVNLSSTKLSKHEESLLSKGLNFCPKPPHCDRGRLIEDNKAFSRKLRLRSHFAKTEPLYDNSSAPLDPEDDSFDSDSLSHIQTQESVSTGKDTLYIFDQDETKYPQFKLRSSWEPPKQSVALETFIHNVESDVTAFQTSSKSRNNLTKPEKQALRSLKNNSSIVIKPADKGSAVVVMDREHYISEAERQLNDTRFYQQLDNDPTLEFQNKVTTALTKMVNSGDISEDNFNYLSVRNPKAGRFYLLPKIHKPGNPGRPIVSANSHPTERISEFIDFHLRPFVVQLPSYVKDTTDYLAKVGSMTIPENSMLVSLDVVSLYTNIPHDEGIAACKEVWETRNEKQPPTETLVELLTLILKCNNFEFNNKHYLQIQGTAMGTKMAPSYANIFMGRLEGKLLTSMPLKPHLWLRFIDDIDMQWCHGQQDLKTFLDMINMSHQTIKFTSEISNEQHVFLDTVSHIDGNKLVTDLHSKPTDKHLYLLPTSCHPRHCCRNIPYSLALRIRRICTQQDDFESRAKELAQHLNKRGYNREVISKAIERAQTVKREELLADKSKQENSKIPFVVTYHPDLPNLRSIIDKHWSKIETSSKLRKVFPEKPIIAYRRPKSLRDILVKAKLTVNNDDSSQGQSGPCNQSRCQTCKIMRQMQTFKARSGAISAVKGVHNCKTNNAVYLMTCNICHKQYVGETKLALNKRMNLHRSDWKTRKFNRSPVAEHFSEPDHSFENIELCCIEANQQWSDEKRKARETYWIRRLNTLQPFGINKNDM